METKKIIIILLILSFIYLGYQMLNDTMCKGYSDTDIRQRCEEENLMLIIIIAFCLALVYAGYSLYKREDENRW